MGVGIPCQLLERTKIRRFFTIAGTESFLTPFCRKECLGVSLDMIRHLLKRLRGKEGECLGRGHQAHW